MNTDGASHGNPSLAGAEGIIRDSQGHFVLGFQKQIGLATSTAAELWAIREGSLMAQLRIQTLQHTFREGNYCVDKLAKTSTLMDDDLVVFEQPPTFISIELFVDVWGTTFPRTCNIRDTHSCCEEGHVPNNDLYPAI
ncbi:hypothetical protein COLO4_30096 [Corchorus olitorius]|uniref:RNase H type-1 domain-containing protein n=1 Tax=Corchorus olitorius TaxID=93759 RepID=A0A1R3HB72_9ROSI|nr:hypothetical protein COLO4_30096 [Corchorus olitorius]